MVKSIINVRRSSICWRGRRELITDVRKPEILGYDVIVGGELFYWLLRSPSQTSRHAKPKTQISRRRTLQASFPLVGCQAAWPERLPLRKVRTLWHCSRLRSVALYLWLIVVISVRQSTVAAISGLHCRALVMVGSSIRLTAWLQNSKRQAEQSERLMYEQSHRGVSPLWLSASSSACHGLLIITVITPLPTKPSATKMPENWSAGERGNCWRTRCVSVKCLLRSIQNTKELADAKAENDALRDDVAAGRRQLHQSSLSIQCVKPPPPPAWIMQPPPTGRHRWTGLFHPQREADHYAKTTGRNPEVY